MEPIVSSCGIAVQPDERLGDPARFDYIVVVGGLVDEIERLNPDYVRFLLTDGQPIAKDANFAALPSGLQQKALSQLDKVQS